MILPAGGYGDGSALMVFLASIRCSIGGHSDPHAGRIDVHIAPAVGATSFGSWSVANRPHRRSNLGRSARGRSRGAITRLDVGRGIRGACQIISEHFWIDGGDCGEGRAVSLVAARPRRVVLLWCISGSRAIPGHCRAIHVPSSLLKAKGIERGWL